MRCLLLFSQTQTDFRVAELEGICRALNVDFSQFSSINKESPIQILDDLDQGDLSQLLSRSILLKTAYELFHIACNYDDLRDLVKASPDIFAPYNQNDATWALRVRPVGRQKRVNVLKRARAFSEFLQLGNAPVSLENPQNKFVILEHYLREKDEHPSKVYFLREIGDGQTPRKHRIALTSR